MIKVITTVGTSLFTNFMREEVAEYLKENHINLPNDFKEDYKRLLKEQTGRCLINTKTAIENCWIKGVEQYQDNDNSKYRSANGLNIHCCAEVQTIEKIKKDIIENKDYEVILLTTDTQLSRLAAAIIKESIYADKVKANISVNGLDVKDSKTFNDDGFKNLFDEVVKIKNEVDEHNNGKKDKDKDSIILNISGGYKGIIPIMTLIGQLLGINIVYMYENSDTLVQIAKLPISFDTTLLEGVASYMNDEYLQTINENSDEYKYFNKHRLLKTENGKTKMSGVGKVLLKALFRGNMSNSILGTFIEYKLFHYFITAPDEEIYEKPQLSLDDNKWYKINEQGIYEFIDPFLTKKGEQDKERLKKEGFSELGDLDIALYEKGKEIFILGEIKSHFQVANKFLTDKNTDEDYYKKIKARIEYWKKENKTIRFLFIIHKIKILQADVSTIFDSDVKEVIKHFKDKINEDYNENVVFEARGVRIEATKKDVTVNYTELFRKPIKYTDFEFYSEQL